MNVNTLFLFLRSEEKKKFRIFYVLANLFRVADSILAEPNKAFYGQTSAYLTEVDKKISVVTFRVWNALAEAGVMHRSWRLFGLSEYERSVLVKVCEQKENVSCLSTILTGTSFMLNYFIYFTVQGNKVFAVVAKTFCTRYNRPNDDTAAIRKLLTKTIIAFRFVEHLFNLIIMWLILTSLSSCYSCYALLWPYCCLRFELLLINCA